MKKQLLFPILALSLVYTSCMDDAENKTSVGGLTGTIIANNSFGTVFNIDNEGASTYYYSNTITNAELPVNKRIYLNYCTLNYDKQAAGTTGAITAPYQLTDVTFTSFETLDQQPMTSISEPSDSLYYISYMKYGESANHRYYFTFFGQTYKDTDPSFALYFDESRNDTLFYDLRIKNSKAVSSKKETEDFIKSFEVDRLPSSYVISLRFCSKSAAGSVGTDSNPLKNDSTYIFSGTNPWIEED